MPGTRLPMRKLRELLRLKAAGLSSRQIGASLGVGGTTVVDYLAAHGAPVSRGRCPTT